MSREVGLMPTITTSRRVAGQVSVSIGSSAIHLRIRVQFIVCRQEIVVNVFRRFTSVFKRCRHLYHVWAEQPGCIPDGSREASISAGSCRPARADSIAAVMLRVVHQASAARSFTSNQCYVRRIQHMMTHTP